MTMAEGLMSRRGWSCDFCFSSSRSPRSGTGALATPDPVNRLNSNPHGPPRAGCSRPELWPPSPKLSSPGLDLRVPPGAAVGTPSRPDSGEAEAEQG